MTDITYATRTTTTKIPSVEVITQDLLDIIRNHTKSAGDDWSGDTTMQEAGIDSFDFVELIFEIEDKYEVSINFNANTSLEELFTVRDVAELIEVQIRTQRNRP